FWPEKVSTDLFTHLLSGLRHSIELAFMVSLCKIGLSTSSSSRRKKYAKENSIEKECKKCPIKNLDVKPKPDHIKRLKEGSLVFAVGAWEEFNQELLRQKVHNLITTPEYKLIPKSLRTALNNYHKQMKKNNFYPKTQKINDNEKSFQKVLLDSIKGKINNYNNPTSKNTDSLFSYLRKDVSKCWNIPNIQNCQDLLDNYVKIRHHLAHGQQDTELENISLKDMVTFFIKISEQQYEIIDKINNWAT
ncbi:MAG: HEPN domain-containing protein, partial [Planctomycetota bacterium]